MLRTVAIIATAVGLASSAATPPPNGPQVHRNYDYIIVGGGTAGLAVATRLSLGLRNRQILVIEAGPEAFDDPEVFVPGKRTQSLGGWLDWNLTSTPQVHANNRVIPQFRGRALGGSSALNFLTHNRASRPEFDWEALGVEGWDEDTFFEAMFKSENYTGINSQYYGDYGVGDSGPIQTVINRNIPAHQGAWIPTLNNLGIPTNLESMGGDVNGVMYQFSTIDPEPWVRSYSANSYLPLAGRNLQVLTETTVARVNLAGGRGKKRATGVTLADGRVINARREVIISAGAMQTPQILELSGIGRSSVLRAAGVRQQIELPGVGENLQDHLRVQVNIQLNSSFTSGDVLIANQTYAAEQLALYYAGQPSLYDYTNSAFAFTNFEQAFGTAGEQRLKTLAQASTNQSPSVRTQIEWLDNPVIPQLEIIYSNGYVGARGYPSNTSELFGESFISLVACLMHPLSRGNVHIRSNNVSVYPVINPNYFAEEHDLEALVDIFKYARKIAQTEPLRSQLVAEYEPGAEVDTDDEIRDYIRRTVVPISHPSGTAALLPREDGGVVDSHLRVYGTENLRVADASIMPVLVSAHITSAVYGIGERAADIILADAR